MTRSDDPGSPARSTEPPAKARGAQVFVTHAADAAAFSRELGARLGAAKVRVFLDDGSRPATQVREALVAAPLFVFVVSADAVAPGAAPLLALGWAVETRRSILGVCADGHEHVIPPPEVAAAPRVGGGHSSSIADTVAEVRERLGYRLSRRARRLLLLVACAGAGAAGYLHHQQGLEQETVMNAMEASPDAGWMAAEVADAGPAVDVRFNDAGLPMGVYIGGEYAPVVAWAGSEADYAGDPDAGGGIGAELARLDGRGGAGAPVLPQEDEPFFDSDGDEWLRPPPDVAAGAGVGQGAVIAPGGPLDGGVSDGGVGDGGPGLGPPPPCPAESPAELRMALQLAVNYCMPAEHQAITIASVRDGELTVGLAHASVAGHNIACVRTMMKRAHRSRGEMLLTPVSWRGCERMNAVVTEYRPTQAGP